MKIAMSLKDARKITIVEKCLDGYLSNDQAAQLLGLSVRQVIRLKGKGRDFGLTSILHQNRGRRSVRSIPLDLQTHIVSLYQSSFFGYNFSHFSDILSSDHNISLSRSSVSRILRAAGFRSPKAKHRPKRHRSRRPRVFEGQLIQMDASRYDWLSNGSYLHLHGAVDDATGKILALQFEKEETFQGYAELMLQMNAKSQLPQEIYVDRRGVFKVNQHVAKPTLEQELAGAYPAQTQFERAMTSLGILLIYAFSPQAKGAIERLWQTLQDRLTKDLKRQGCDSVVKANAFLPAFITTYNRKFAVPAARPELLYKAHVPIHRFLLVLAQHEKRVLDNGLSFSFYSQRYTLPPTIGHTKILASPKDVVTVAYSQHLGIRVIHKGLVLKPVKLTTKSDSSLVSLPEKSNQPIDYSSQGRQNSEKSPWRTYGNWINPSRQKSDIFTDQSAP